jgi:hypothetical protein
MGLWERIYLRADAKIPRPEMSAGCEFLGVITALWLAPT